METIRDILFPLDSSREASIIIGRGSLSSPLARLRTHAYEIIQKSPWPVVSI